MSKPALTYQEQLELLKTRGLEIADEAHALHCLANYNYYRLSIYWRHFTDPSNGDQFAAGTTFEHIWDLYQFDRGLRALVNEACKRLEISARTQWAYELGQEFGPQAYEHPEVFAHKPRHTKLLAWFDARFEESKEDFVLHYKGKRCPRPEIWIAVELFDFGTLRYFYNATKRAQTRRRIADHYQLPEPIFSSLLTHCNYLRNLCAHHSRLWNRKLTFKLSTPEKHPESLISSLEHFPEDEEVESRKLYNSLVLLSHVNRIIAPEADWTSRLLQHMQTLHHEQLPGMGFPADWQSRPIWNFVNG